MKNEEAHTVSDEVSTATAITNYICNTFFPYICIFAILLYTNAFDMWLSYLILPLMYFSSKYSFRCGIAHVLAEAIDDTDGKLQIRAETEDKE
jgi:hypothetical protein